MLYSRKRRTHALIAASTLIGFWPPLPAFVPLKRAERQEGWSYQGLGGEVAVALGVDGPGKRPSVPQGKPLTAGLAELVLEEASPETAIVEARPGLVNAFVLCSASLARGVGPPGSSLSPIIFPIHPPCV